MARPLPQDEGWPDSPAARDAFVLSRRGRRNPADPWRTPRVLIEDECAADGTVVRSAAIFLTGRECPWRCVMCDLWKHTLESDTPRAALPAQIQLACRRLDDPRPTQVKLYNAGSFFDPRAVPLSDYDAIALTVAGFRHVVVESHPLLVGPHLLRWREALNRAAPDGRPPTLEVAIGLETANAPALERLHKRFTLDDFARAAERTRASGSALRVFLLVGLPFIHPAEQLEWIRRSAEYATGCGASVVSLIPTRTGNGALEALTSAGLFHPPTLRDLEDAFDAVLQDVRGRVLADIWDLESFSTCRACFEPRRARLNAMNLTQQVLPRVACEACGAGSSG
ncbi:MAG TPA: hypothetical protein VNK41_05060 [Vicinamibacterales bacterium]|nr:hypothetical protein [Vicinamibacterales bacterium]